MTVPTEMATAEVLTHVDLAAVRRPSLLQIVHFDLPARSLTFSSFVLGQRLSRGHRMLGDPRFPDRNISSVAFDVGFGDLSYFNRTFRRNY
jgi:hypothetical protein